MKNALFAVCLAGFAQLASANPYRISLQIEHEGKVQTFHTLAELGRPSPISHLDTISYRSDCSAQGKVSTGTHLVVTPVYESNGQTMLKLDGEFSKLVKIDRFLARKNCEVELPSTRSATFGGMTFTLKPGERQTFEVNDISKLPTDSPYKVTIELQ